MFLEYLFEPAAPATAGYARAARYLSACGFACRTTGSGVAARLYGRPGSRYIPLCPQTIYLGLDGGRYCLAYELVERRALAIGRSSGARRTACRRWMAAQALAVERAVRSGIHDVDVIRLVAEARRRRRRRTAVLASLLLGLLAAALVLLLSTL
ncbi:MAG: hypothetical protein PHN82_09395 [bacterium]|nr:hypothetical protein [bacterium]